MRSIWTGLTLMILPLLAGILSTSRMSYQEPLLEFSCNAFPADMSDRDLIDRFGADKVTTLVPLRWRGEYMGRGTVLFPESEDMLEIVWKDEEAMREPRYIVVRGDRSRWRTPSGIMLGIDLKALEELNEGPFRLAGFQTEANGAVRSWANGALHEPNAGQCRVTIHLKPDANYDFATFRQVRWGREYSSGHPAMQELNPTVVSLSVTR